MRGRIRSPTPRSGASKSLRGWYCVERAHLPTPPEFGRNSFCRARPKFRHIDRHICFSEIAPAMPASAEIDRKHPAWPEASRPPTPPNLGRPQHPHRGSPSTETKPVFGRTSAPPAPSSMAEPDGAPGPPEHVQPLWEITGCQSFEEVWGIPVGWPPPPPHAPHARQIRRTRGVTRTATPAPPRGTRRRRWSPRSTSGEARGTWKTSPPRRTPCATAMVVPVAAAFIGRVLGWVHATFPFETVRGVHSRWVV